MKHHSLTKYVLLLQAVADQNRLRILGCLLVRPACVCELTQATGIPQPRLSRHLRILKNAGLVQDRREAQWVEYSVVAAAEGSPEAAVLRLVEQLLVSDAAVENDRTRLAVAVRASREAGEARPRLADNLGGLPAPERSG